MTIDPAVLETLHRELGEKLTEFTSSDAWLTWLHGARQFHRYSPGNQLLLMLQGAHGHVASYRTWQRIPAVDGEHCQVRKGEHGLTILAPMTVTRRDVDEASGDEIVVAGAVKGFRPVKVFHQHQLVAPPDLPERPLPALLSGADRWQHAWTAVTAQLADEGYPVELHTAGPGETWNGRTHFVDGYVEVMDHLDPPQRLKTLLHEWAHVTLRHGDIDRPPTRELLEIEAESVAYLLCRTIGLDSSSYSIPYLANWAGGDHNLAETTAQRILTATAAMVDTLEARLSIDLTPDLFTTATAPPAALTAHHRVTRAETGPLATPGVANPDRAGRPAPVSFELESRPGSVQASPVLRDLLNRLNPWDHAVLVGAVNHLDRPDDRATALALCADAGYDTAHAAATLLAAGAEPVSLRRSMKQATFINDEGERRSMFNDIDAAFRVGTPPTTLEPATADVLHRFDVDDPTHVVAAVRVLAGGGQHRPREVAEVLTYLGVDQADIRDAMTAVIGTDQPAQGTPGSIGLDDPREVLRCRVAEHEALLRRVIDEARDPTRAAALATGLGMSYSESVAACAHLGLDPGFTAQVAVARRNGHITDAASDLAAGWTASPPVDGWSTYLPVDPAVTHDSAVTSTTQSAARAVLAQWRQAATPPPTPAMT
jgi:hypothetical protein